MLKYENKKRMIRKKNSESFSFFLRISGTINGFFKVYSFSLMQIGVTPYMPIKLRLGIGGCVAMKPNHAISISGY